MFSLPLAMHMANELLSVPVAVVTILLAAAMVALSARMAIRRIGADALGLMGVMGAFVFAAQMINFPIPPGTSGHLVGGVLLAVLLGPWAAVVTIAAILIVQCLLFQDGGILALGCNIINMGVVQCLLGWCVYRGILGRGRHPGGGRQYLAAWAACVVGVAGGAALVPLETGLSGVLQIPWADFFQAMVGVHLLIGFVEGLITFAVLAYVRKVRPEALGLPINACMKSATPIRIGGKAFAFSILVTAMAVGGLLSWFACTHPDGLEYCLGHNPAGPGVKNNSTVVVSADELQSRTALLPDYSRREAPIGSLPAAAKEEEKAAPWPNFSGWTSLAGLIGTGATLVLVYGIAAMLRRSKRLPAS